MLWSLVRISTETDWVVSSAELFLVREFGRPASPYPCLASLGKIEQARKEYGSSKLRQLAATPSAKANLFRNGMSCNLCFRRHVRLLAGGRREACNVSWPLAAPQLENERLHCEQTNRLANHKQTWFGGVMTTLRLSIMR